MLTLRNLDFKSCVTAFVIALAVFVFFLPVYGFEFLNFDDPIYVTENPHVLSGLTIDSIRWAFTSEHGAHWHPLSWLSHMLDVSLFGVHSGAHHLVNAAWHSLNAGVLFLLLARLNIFSRSAAVFICLAFALHPMRLESVAWVTERKDVLSLFFILLTFHSYISYATRSTQRGPTYYLIFPLLLLALLAKPSAVVVPALFLAFDYWPLHRSGIGWLHLLREKVPFFLLIIVFSLTTIIAQESGGGLKSFDAYPLEYRIYNVLVSYCIYFAKLVVPLGQGIFYPFVIYPQSIAAQCAILLTAISALVFIAGKQRPYLTFGLLWYAISLLPVIGIIQVGGQSYADRWSYIPHIGLLIAAVAWWKDSYGKLGIPLGIGIVAIFALLSGSQLRHWRSSEAIFRHTIQVAPNNFMAEMNLGLALRSKGERIDGAHHLRNAVLLQPSLPDALNNLAVADIESGNTEHAERLLRRAVAIDPNYEVGRLNLVRLLSEKARPGAALEAALAAHMDRAIKSDFTKNIEMLAGMPCDKFEHGWKLPQNLLGSETMQLSRYSFALRLALQRLSRCGDH